MVGEIRDLETAKVAFEFAATGRPVLSTVHTNSAVGAVQRLSDMGIEPYVLASTLRSVIAQRLVRKLCSSCKQPRAAEPGELELLGISSGTPVELYEPKGCMACSHSGYNGRLGIYELMVLDNALKEAIRSNASDETLNALAFAEHDTLFQNAVPHILSGMTSLEEVLRVCRKDDEG